MNVVPLLPSANPSSVATTPLPPKVGNKQWLYSNFYLLINNRLIYNFLDTSSNIFSLNEKLSLGYVLLAKITIIISLSGSAQVYVPV